jgi:hypothetical protein
MVYNCKKWEKRLTLTKFYYLDLLVCWDVIFICILHEIITKHFCEGCKIYENIFGIVRYFHYNLLTP